MKYLSRILFLLNLGFVALGLVSCKAINFGTLAEQRAVDFADNIARRHSFQKKLIQGGKFTFTTFQKIDDDSADYVVYIEGDGLLVDKGMISKNPTPSYPMLLELATKDRRANVIYIARPCQYTPMDLNPACEISYWTDKRWSEDSVSAMNEAIKKIVGKKRFALVGFSGGAGIAVLIAAKNPQVKSILTIAGNMDHVLFNKLNRTMPCLNSLNPIDYAQKINHIPQMHFAGENDKKVTPFLVNEFVKASKSNCVHFEVLPRVDHNHGWIRNWDYIMNVPLGCY